MLKLLLTVLFVPTFAFADWTQWKAEDFELAAHPRKGSAANRSELGKMLEAQQGDRREACAMGRRQPWANYEILFARSGQLTAEEAAMAKPLVHRVLNLTQKITRKFKEQYNRERPYEYDSRIQPCVMEPGTGTSYPSSHASMGWTGACILAKIFPGKSRALKAYGKTIGDIRATIGVHHPSDVEVGQALGAEICHSLLADAGFKQELRALRQQ